MREGRRQHQVILTLTSHTTDGKSPTNKTLEPPTGPAHDDAVILRQPGGQHQDCGTHTQWAKSRGYWLVIRSQNALAFLWVCNRLYFLRIQRIK